MTSHARIHECVEQSHVVNRLRGLFAAQGNVEAGDVEQHAAARDRDRLAELHDPPENRAIHALAPLVRIQFIGVDDIANH